MSTPAYTKIQTVYSDRANATDAAIHDAVSAVLSGKCTSPVVLLGLDTLVSGYELKGEQPEIERLERYLVECWAEYTAAPTGGGSGGGSTFDLTTPEERTAEVAIWKAAALRGQLLDMSPSRSLMIATGRVRLSFATSCRVRRAIRVAALIHHEGRPTEPCRCSECNAARARRSPGLSAVGA